MNAFPKVAELGDEAAICEGGEVREVEAALSSFPGAHRRLLKDVLWIVVLELGDGRIVKGYGQSPLRADSRSNTRDEGAWRQEVFEAFREVTDSLRGTAVDISSRGEASASIRSIVRSLKSRFQEAGDLPAALFFGLATALIDATAKAKGWRAAEVLYPESGELRSSVPLAGAPAHQRRMAVGPERADRGEQDAGENGPTERTMVHAYRFSDPIELAECMAELASETGSPISVLGTTGAGLFSTSVLTHIAAGGRGGVVLPELPPRVLTEAVVEGPGFGETFDWEEVLSSHRVPYYTSGSLQSEYDRPANSYPGERLAVLGPNGGPAQAMTQSVLARGLNTVRYAKGSFAAEDKNGMSVPFVMSRTQLSGVSASAICNRKDVTRAILDLHGVPTAAGRLFKRGDIEGPVSYAERIGFPVVAKPAKGFRGIGVFARIEGPGELREALAHIAQSRLGHQDILIEEHVNGEEYRILVVGDRAVAAIQRVPASVRGDGVHCVAELILRKNQFRRQNPSLRYRPIVVGADARMELASQGLLLGDVPPAGQLVTLSSTSNLSQGGDSVDILEEMHPSILDAAVKATQAIPGLGFAGVDFLVESPEKPLSEQKTAVLEMNAHASISGAVFPMHGKPRNIPEDFVNLLGEKLSLEMDPSPRDLLTVRIRVRGRVRNVGYEDWAVDLANELGLRGWVRGSGPREVVLVVSGESADVATFSIAAVMGPKGSAPTSAETKHMRPVAVTDFKRVEADPEAIRLEA